MGLSRRIADFVVGLDESRLPPEVIAKAKACLFNGYGIALGCHTTPFAPVARRAALAMDGEVTGGATLLGDGRKTSVDGAALANSALFHGRGQEDTCGAAHIGAIIIPLLTALIEARGYPTDRLIPALVAGYEAGGLLENAYSGHTTPAGLRASPLYGTIAAAAAASRMMGLDAGQTAAALANAAAFTGGILQSFEDGTDEWRYQVGVAGRLGHVAAQLALAGSYSAPHAFEGRAGFVAAFARTRCDADALATRLGRDWSIHRVTFKPFPVCAFNQTPVTAALMLREQIGDRAIARLRVRMNPFETGYAGMDSKGPFSTLSGTLMSIPFCIANTLRNGTPTVDNMTAYDDAAVNALVERIDLVSDEGVARLCCVIEVELEDGSRLTREQLMTPADYSYDWPTVSALVRRVGAETGVDASVYDRLAAFADDPAAHRIDDLLACFAALPKAEAVQ
ncbi:MAG: MmgE/PrpD family protein [Burkholderiaceae bacterium]